MENIFDGKPGKGKNGCDGTGSEFVQPGEKDTQVQLVISLALGSTAFIAFCVRFQNQFPRPKMDEKEKDESRDNWY